MRECRRALYASVAAAAVLLVAGGTAAPLRAQVSMTDPDAHVACGAFQRSGHGVWTAVAPTILDYTNGITFPIAPGQIFAPNQTLGGVEITATLDRHCGNR